MSTLSALRALVRIELRDARRQPWRSWLVVLLVAVPVAAMVGGSAVFRTTQATPDERLARQLGSASLRVEFDGELDEADLRVMCGEGARIESLRIRRADVGGPPRRVPVRLLETSACGAQPSLALGMFRIVEGRAPDGPDEIALAPLLVSGLGLAVGDRVPVDGVERSICGLVLDPEDLDAPVGFVTRTGSARVWLIEPPHSELDGIVERLRARARAVFSRVDPSPADGFEELVVFVVGGFAFFEAALVIGAAFAVGLRRRQREVGLVGANGAAARDIMLSLVLATVVLASLGIVLGMGVGIGAAHALQPWLDGWNRRWNGPLELSALHAFGAVALGWFAAVGAVAAPAWSAAQLPVRIALSGRRPVAGSSRGGLIVGLALVGGGFGWMAVGARGDGALAAIGILGGSISGVLGLGACSPWLLSLLARLAAPLPLAWRLAARDSGRFRARNGPVVLAVLAGLSVSVMLSSIVGSVDSMVAAQAQVESAARSELLPVSVEVAATPERPLIDFALVASFLTGLVVVFVATALSAAESASDARVLESVGAAPGVLRTHLAARASYLALLGALLAIPAGLLPSYGLVAYADVDLSFQAPWSVLALALLGLPALAFVGAWLLAGWVGAPSHRSPAH